MLQLIVSCLGLIFGKRKCKGYIMRGFGVRPDKQCGRRNAVCDACLPKMEDFLSLGTAPFLRQ